MTATIFICGLGSKWRHIFIPYHWWNILKIASGTYSTPRLPSWCDPTLWYDVIWCIMRFSEAKEWRKQFNECKDILIHIHSRPSLTNTKVETLDQIWWRNRCKSSIFGFILKSAVCLYISVKVETNLFSDKNPVIFLLFSSKMHKVITNPVY